MTVREAIKKLKDLKAEGWVLIELEAGFMPYLIREWAEAEKSIANARLVVICLDEAGRVATYKIYR